PYTSAIESLEGEGYRFANFRDLGATDENWLRLWQLAMATDKDTPGAEYWSLGTPEEFRMHFENMYGFLPEGLLIALYNGQWVGVNMLSQRPTAGQMATEFTGVRREFRGKGLAQALKVRGIQFAAERGAQTMITNNDERN